MTKSILKSYENVFAVYPMWFINMNKNAYLLSSMAGVSPYQYVTKPHLKF